VTPKANYTVSQLSNLLQDVGDKDAVSVLNITQDYLVRGMQPGARS